MIIDYNYFEKKKKSLLIFMIIKTSENDTRYPYS